MQQEHQLKTWICYFEAIERNEKRFEIRVNDRDFKVGDLLVLQEFDNTKGEFTGRECTRLVTYITKPDNPWVLPGYVVMSIEPVFDEAQELTNDLKCFEDGLRAGVTIEREHTKDFKRRNQLLGHALELAVQALMLAQTGKVVSKEATLECMKMFVKEALNEEKLVSGLATSLGQSVTYESQGRYTGSKGSES